MATFYLNHEAELYHYGIKGMRWGKHKYRDAYYAARIYGDYAKKKSEANRKVDRDRERDSVERDRNARSSYEIARDEAYNYSMSEKEKAKEASIANDMKEARKIADAKDKEAAYRRAESAHLNAKNQSERERRGREEALRRSESINKAMRRGKSDYARINNMKKLSKTATPSGAVASSLNPDLRKAYVSAHKNAVEQHNAEVRGRRAALEYSKPEKKKKEKKSLANSKYYRGKR